ncbi:MAG: DUF6519 domain-containing protein [Lysobacter sp.]
MKGDFSRVSFDPRNHFSQVLLQQGRVTLDADPNEQGAILLHYLRTLARDLFGPYAAPADNAGFGLEIVDENGEVSLIVGAGRYYVQGVLCETDGFDYIDQPYFTPQPDSKDNSSGDPLRRWLEASNRDDEQRFWVYLKVWERHVTSVEMPSLREVALGGPDTCSRMQVVWQVRAMAVDDIEDSLQERLEALKKQIDATKDDAERQHLQEKFDQLDSQLNELRENYQQACSVPLSLFERDPLPELAARLQPSDRLDDPCITSPDSAYRGAENHLYRVEIHRGTEDGDSATFKWSRDNGSVLARWISGGGSVLDVANARDFRDAKWIELSDDEDDLLGRSGTLCKIASVEGNRIVLTAEQDRQANASSKARRWDQVSTGDIRLIDGAVSVKPDAGQSEWIDLEDGVQVRFAADREYRSGDYWLIPARTTGQIEWPQDAAGEAQYLPPRGVEYYYAPLGFVGFDDSGNPGVESSCRCLVHPTSTCGILQPRLRADGDRVVVKPQNADAVVVADTTKSTVVAKVAKATTKRKGKDT